LNVRSEDLATPARIRHVALARFGTDGYAGSSVRTIAADAGVSPALILHHFGSKEGLREACDEHVFRFFQAMLARVAETDPTESMTHFEGFTDESMTLMRYLMRQASEDSPRANAFVAEIIELTKESMAAQTAKGFVKPTADPDMRAAVLVMLRLGPLLFAGAMEEATGSDVLEPDGLRRMYRATIEILSSGIYTSDHGELLAKYDATAERDTRDH
jgi:AcrR family transcriptional regulator